MNKIANLLIRLFFCVPVVLQAQTQKGLAEPVGVTKGAKLLGPFKPTIFKGNLSHLPIVRPWKPGDPIKTIPKRNNHQGKPKPIQPPANPLKQQHDPLLQTGGSRVAASERTLTASSRYPGQVFSGVYPPDPVGDVGENYYIQMINNGSGTSFTVYNKSDGVRISGPVALKTLGSGVCADGAGDPIVLYDSMAKRWFLSEFSSKDNTLCVYISTTSDPISGGWAAYQFVSAISFPDYPKYAVWIDGYYLTTNEISPGIYVLDRQAMLAGQPAGMQFFSVSSLAGFGFQALLPSDLDGPNAPPKGAPNYLIRHRDDEVHNPTVNNPDVDYLDLFEFRVNWTDQALSSLTGPISIAVADFDSDVCGLSSFDCFPQPGTTMKLDPVREVVMWRFPYRNFGDRETLVGNFVVDVNGSDHGGIRWFELRKTTGSWELYQEGTEAPDDSHRWMGSVAMDGSGNLALAYSVVDGVSTYPSVRYTGRDSNDNLGVLPQGETSIQVGLGAQTAVNRWGDYSSLNIDPVDDCTFWYTHEYVLENGAWDTVIANFRFDSCGAPAFIMSTSSELEQSVCAGSTLLPISLDILSVGGFSDLVNLSFDPLLAEFSGDFTPNPVAAPGTAQASLQAFSTAVAGSYAFDILGQGVNVEEKRLSVKVEIFDVVPATTTLLLPEHGATGQDTSPILSWNTTPNSVSYRLEIATDEAFSNILYSVQTTDPSHAVDQTLASDTAHYWRVTSSNACGTGEMSGVFRFDTRTRFCSAPLLEIPDGSSDGVSDLLLVAEAGVIADLNVELKINHSWVGDLVVTLEHVEAGITVILLDAPGALLDGYGCSGDDVDTTLDDQGDGLVEDACLGSVPAITGKLIPNEALSAFSTIPVAGSWRLKLVDRALGDLGTLLSWCLSPVYEGIDCDGANVLLANKTIAAGEQVTCKVVDIQLENVTVEGSLLIERTGTVILSPDVRSVPPDGEIVIRDGVVL